MHVSTVVVLVLAGTLTASLVKSPEADRPVESVRLSSLNLDDGRVDPCGDDTCIGCSHVEGNATWTDTPNGELEVGQDRECSAEVNCGEYACDPTQDEEAQVYLSQVALAVDLLRTATPEDMFSFISANPTSVLVNRDRSAVQFRGCGDTILGYVPLDSRTYAALENLLTVADEG